MIMKSSLTANHTRKNKSAASVQIFFRTVMPKTFAKEAISTTSTLQITEVDELADTNIPISIVENVPGTENVGVAYAEETVRLSDTADIPTGTKKTALMGIQNTKFKIMVSITLVGTGTLAGPGAPLC